MVGRLRIGAAPVLALVLALSLAGGASAKPGQVDTRYGFNGTVDISDALPGPEFQRGALAAAVGPQDESFVLSYALRPCAVVGGCADLHVIRVGADGAPDAAFAARVGTLATVELGTCCTPTGPNGAIAVQPDGKVIVAAGDGAGIRVLRLDPDGGRDLSFRDPGDPARPPGESFVFLANPASVTALAARPTGQIVVTGSSAAMFFVSQLTGDGRPDSGFGARGTHFDSFQPGALPGDLLLRGARILVGGNACCSTPTSMALAEFDAAGTLDDVVRVGLPKRLRAGKPKGIADVIAGPKGSTFVVGSAAKGTFVAKYRGNGRPDPSFRTGGFALLRGLRSEPGSALRDSRGRIVVLGSRLDVPDTAGFRARFVSTTRLLPSGRYDPTYGGARPLLVVEDGGVRTGLDFARSIGLAQRSDGLLIMLGEAPADRYAKVAKGPRFGLVRYFGGGRLP